MLPFTSASCLLPTGLAATVLLLTGFAYSPSPGAGPGTPQAPPATNERVYTGTIGRLPVVLRLDLSDTTSRVTGHYYYLRRGSDLALTGQRWSDSLDLGETEEPPQRQDYFEATARLRARLSGDTLITGYWQATGKQLRLPVKLRRRQQAYDYAYAARLSPAEQWPTAWVYSVVYTNDSPNNDPEEFDPGQNDDPAFTVVEYPLVAGLADKRVEAVLNDWLRPEFSYAWARTRLRSGQQYSWLNGCYTRSTSIRALTAEVISVVRRSTTEGCSSPPYQVEELHTIRQLADLRALRLSEQLQGNFRALFRRCIQEQLPGQVNGMEQVGGRPDDPDNHCRVADIVRVIQARLDTTRTTDGMLIGPAGLSICYFNLNEFCAWPAVGSAEVVVPYEVLRPYLRPNSALARALPAAARRP